jgi:hypothetical protein
VLRERKAIRVLQEAKELKEVLALKVVKDRREIKGIKVIKGILEKWGLPVLHGEGFGIVAQRMSMAMQSLLVEHLIFAF